MDFSPSDSFEMCESGVQTDSWFHNFCNITEVRDAAVQTEPPDIDPSPVRSTGLFTNASNFIRRFTGSAPRLFSDNSKHNNSVAEAAKHRDFLRQPMPDFMPMPMPQPGIDALFGDDDHHPNEMI